MNGAEDTPPTQELSVEAAGDPSAPPSPERRYRALAVAVRRHQAVSSHPAVPKRPADHALYAALAEIDSRPPPSAG